MRAFVFLPHAIEKRNQQIIRLTAFIILSGICSQRMLIGRDRGIQSGQAVRKFRARKQVRNRVKRQI